MAEPFIGQISMFGFSFAPRGWALCDGQLLPINQNQALFSLLGTIYGGDGRTTFALPDLRGRVPFSHGQGPGLSRRDLGERGGAPTHTLTVGEMPGHAHAVRASSGPATDVTPAAGRVLARSGGAQLYGPPEDLIAGAGSAATGGGQAHSNQQPFLVVTICIALQGVFPSRN